MPRTEISRHADAINRIALIDEADARDAAIDAACDAHFAAHGRHLDPLYLFTRTEYVRGGHLTVVAA